MKYQRIPKLFRPVFASNAPMCYNRRPMIVPPHALQVADFYLRICKKNLAGQRRSARCDISVDCVSSDEMGDELFAVAGEKRVSAETAGVHYKND